MKKNYFKILMAIAIMVMTGVSFTSCDEQLDNPVVDPTEAETEEPVIVETATGAEITINTLSDISGLLGELTPMIKAKNGEEFVLDVKSNGSLKVTETDNIILVPNVAGCNLVINFDNSLVSDGSAVTMKLDSKAATRAMVDENGVVYDKNVALNLKNTNTDLILDVPGVTVTVSTLNSIQVLNGLSIVKEGASINTYVYAPKSNDVALYAGAAEDVQVNWINDETGEKEGWGTFPAVRSLKEWQYHFKNIKVLKGKADFARINAWDEEYKLEKLTIAEGATVVLGGSMVKEIVGEGNGAIVKSNNAWWRNSEEKTVNAQLNLYDVEKISNITFEVLLENDLKDGKLVESSAHDVPAAIENCTFKYGKIRFRNPQSASATVKECKFIGTDEEKSIRIYVPYQTEEITGFKFSFDKCEFPKDCKFDNDVQTSKPILDEKGNQVYKKIYRWWIFDGDQPDWVWYKSETLDGVPADKKEIGECNGGWDNTEGKSLNGYSTGYWIEQEPQFEEVEFKDYYIYVSFTECKIDGAALTPSNISISNWTPRGAYLRYEFDGKIYRALWDGENEKYMLIEAN